MTDRDRHYERSDEIRLRILAAQFARVVREFFAPKNRGRRECRVPHAPAASRANVKTTHTIVVTTGSPVSPGIPRAMVLTAYFVFSPVTSLVDTVAGRRNIPPT
jgi:hypothetical protein